MTTKVVLRRSAKDGILWHFHVVLDHMPEGNAGRAKFAREILREFGVSWRQRLRLVPLITQKLPDDLHDVDMTEILRVFEDVLEIEWDEDVHWVDREAAAAFVKTVLTILEARTPAQLPKEIASRMVDELALVVGSRLDPTLLPGISQKLESLFINELWRTKDHAAREELTRRVLYCLKGAARLDFSKASDAP
jgi:hypothetical protein